MTEEGERVFNRDFSEERYHIKTDHQVTCILSLPPILNHPLPVPHFPIGLNSPSPIPSHGIYSLAFPYSICLLPAFEDGTDTWFRNVGISHIDAGEIPKRTYTLYCIINTHVLNNGPRTPNSRTKTRSEYN